VRRRKPFAQARKYGHRMTSGSPPSICGMPPVRCPHFFGVEATNQLANHRLNTTARPRQIWRKRRFLARSLLERFQKCHAFSFQPPIQTWAPVVSIGQCLAAASEEHLESHRHVAHVCRSEIGVARNPARRPRPGRGAHGGFVANS
jgi:hypothetical protein